MRWILFGLLLTASSATAQVSDITVTIDPGDVGLGGFVRPGSWAPMVINIDNPSPSARRVRCRWTLPDVDGDPVLFERIITLTPQRRGRAFIYGAIPYNTPPNPQWRLLVIDDETGKAIASEPIPVGNQLHTRESAIAITGAAHLDLQRFDQNLTQHETMRMIRGFDPSHLPDRWQGLDMIEALIWTTDSPDPAAPSVSAESIKALRRWISRGGHLVVVLPALGDDLWTQSPLADVLPAVEVHRVRGVMPPPALGSPREQVLIDARRLVPRGKTTVIFEDAEIGPWVVTHAFGAGRVTMVGVDLSDRRLSQQALPNAPDLWMKIFGWRSRSTRGDIDGARENARSRLEQAIEAGGFVRPLVAMRETFSGALTLAVAVFLFYWLAAGPVGHWLLRSKGMVRHAWVGFVVMVALFTAVCWGGALVLRPKVTRVAHVSVLDINGDDNSVHSHSWLSLFVARHGRVDIAIDPDKTEGNYNAIAAMGLPRAEFESVFLDPQRYVVNAAAPHRASVPYRATAKQFEADFQGLLNEQPDSNGVSWVMPQTYMLQIVDGFPQGQVTHGLPGTLRDVMALYCPGEGKEPWVWNYEQWHKGELLEVARPTGARRFVSGSGQNWGGYLTERISQNKPLQRFGTDDASLVKPARNETILGTELLTFYSTLPPPNWWEEDWKSPNTHYHRSLGRPFDLTHMLQTRCLIIIGYLYDAPLPMPLHVDGETVRGQGMTVVRWVMPL